MQKSLSSEFITGITSTEIDHLVMFSSPCSECASAHKKYFCIDQQCKKRSLVCGQCHKNDINYEHYTHEIVYIKQFLTEGKYLCFKEVIEKYERFVNIFSSKANEVQVIYEELRQWELRFIQNLEKLKMEISSSGFLDFQLKLNRYKELFRNKKKKNFLSLQAIFQNYRYVSPNQLFKKVKNFDDTHLFFQNFTEASDKIDYNQLRNQFSNSFHKFQASTAQTISKQYEISEVNKNYIKIRDIFTDNFQNSHLTMSLKAISESLSEKTTNSILFKRDSSLLYLNQLKKVKILNVDVDITQSTLQNILNSMDCLEEINLKRAFENKPLFQEKCSLSHENIETISLYEIQKINDGFLKNFLEYKKFPALKKIRINNITQNIQLTPILSKNFRHIEYFELKTSEKLNEVAKNQLLSFLSMYNFKEIRLSGVQFNQEEKKRYKHIINSKVGVIGSITDQDIEFSSYQSNAYAIFKYQKYKPISKRTFRNIVKEILT